MEKKILKAAKKYFNNYQVEDNKITVLYDMASIGLDF